MTDGSQIAEALAKVQAELKPIPRTRKGQRGKYADLAAVEEAVFPLLARAGLVFLAKPTLTADGRFVLAYSLLHTSGEREDGEYPLHGGGNAQQQGSEVTYARRYSLCAITGAAPEGEDDDGGAASDERRGQAPQRAPQRPTAPVTRTRTAGADHERLRHGAVERTPDDRPARRDRGPVPDEQNPWQDVPPEEQPGSADPKDVQRIQIAYNKLGFDHRTDRGQLLNISEQILGHALTGPKPGRTHNNLSFPDARKLKDTLEAFKGDRGALMERLTGITQTVAEVTAQDAAEGGQEPPGGTDG